MTPGFEPGNQGFADPRLTTWLCHHFEKDAFASASFSFGADDEARTRYLHLGKVALYQMSYVRIWCLRSESNQWHGDFQSPALPTELQRQMWRPGTGSNRRPLAWQASVLTSWTTGPYPERFGPILFELRPNAFSFIRKTCGGNNRARTCDPLLVRQVLSQLSYAPKNAVFKRFFPWRSQRRVI